MNLTIYGRINNLSTVSKLDSFGQEPVLAKGVVCIRLCNEYEAQQVREAPIGERVMRRTRSRRVASSRQRYLLSSRTHGQMRSWMFRWQVVQVSAILTPLLFWYIDGVRRCTVPERGDFV